MVILFWFIIVKIRQYSQTIIVLILFRLVELFANQIFNYSLTRVLSQVHDIDHIVSFIFIKDYCVDCIPLDHTFYKDEMKHTGISIEQRTTASLE